MDYQRLPEETDFEWKLRLCKAKLNKEIDLDWAEIVDILGLECSADHLRKISYGILEYDTYQSTSKISSIQDDDILKEYELKIQELKKEKIKVQTEKLALNQMLREEARYELFVERAIQEIRNNNKIVIPNRINSPVTSKKSGVLFLADCHYGKELLIKGLHNEILNEYSVEIFEQRMWKLLYETIDICKKEGFTEIDVMNLGDELEGMLRISQLMSLKYGLIESSIRFAEFFATWINELTKYIRVRLYSTCGNHTDARLLTNRKGDFPQENVSKFINRLIKEILRDNSNVEIHENNTDAIYTTIQGYNILGIHGEEKNVQQAIRDYDFIYGVKIDYLASGHKHHANSVNLGFRKGCIGVGSIIGVDDYSMSLKRISDPTSTFVILQEGKGKVQEYTIILN